MVSSRILIDGSTKSNGHEPVTQAWEARFARIEQRLAKSEENTEQRVLILRDACCPAVSIGDGALTAELAGVPAKSTAGLGAPISLAVGLGEEDSVTDSTSRISHSDSCDGWHIAYQP